MKKLNRALALSFLASLTSLAQAADWPQWRGPARDGTSPETNLLKEWPATGPKLLWQVKDLGDGYSTPSVVGDRLYVMSNKGSDDEFVQARDVKDGKPLWSTRVGKVGPNTPQMDYPGARSTPTIDGTLLYALGSNGDLACLENATGKVVWQKSLRTDFGGKPGAWAYAESPLVDGDRVICTPGGKDATLLALDKATGAVVWKYAAAAGDEAGYSSPIVSDAPGGRQYVQFLHNGLVGLDAKTGKELWSYGKTADTKMGGNIQTPLAHNGMIYSASGTAGGGVVRLEAKRGHIEPMPVYFDLKLPTGMGGVVRVGDHLFGTTRTNLLCTEFATGKQIWSDRSVGSAAVCAADGRLYVRGSTGEIALVEATAEGYRETGRFTPPNQPDRGKSKAWTYPVVANGKLYLRDLGSLWCYDVARE